MVDAIINTMTKHNKGFTPTPKFFGVSSRSERGFTLIEILVVVAIIGVLASIVLVGLGGARRQGGDAKRIAELRQIQTGLELYFTKCGAYPGGASTGSCHTTDPASWADLQRTLIDAGIGVSTVPDDSAAPTKNYYYAVRSDRQAYVLGTKLSVDNAALQSDYDGSLAGYASTGSFDCAADTAPNYTYCIAP